MRTKKSIYNFISDALPYLVLGILSFLRIKFLIKYYGEEVNGYIQLITQVFAYLSLAEAGFGTAVMYKLYKPLADNDKEKISSIVVGSKQIFKKIAFVMTIGSFVCSILIPIFINKGNLSISFTVSIFLLNSVHYLLEYFLIYPYTTLLQADQNQYISNFYRNLTKILFGLLELYLMSLTLNLLLIIGINVIFTLIYVLLVMKKVKKLYPWLDEKAKPDTSAFKMTKDVVVHKISNLIFTKTDPIILSRYSLNYVSIYSSYNYILEFLTTIISKLYNALRSSYCNIVALNKTEDKKYFKIFLSFSFFIACFCSLTFYTTVNLFVGKVWLDENNVFNISVVTLFAIIMFGRIIINPIYVARDSKGLFKETKGFTVLQAITNIVLSIILVKKYQIFGVLLATCISQYLILIPSNVYIIYKKIFNVSIFNFIKRLLIGIIFITMLYFVDQSILNLFILNSKSIVLIIMTLIAFVNFIVLFVLYNIFDKDFMQLTKELFRKIGKRI